MMNFRGIAGSAMVVALYAAAPAYADNLNVVLGTIDAGSSKTAQVIHTQKGTFTDTISYIIGSTGTGNGVYTLQFLPGLKSGSKPLQNITGAEFNLLNEDTGSYIFGSATTFVSLVSGAAFDIPFTAGNYLATVKGNATGTSKSSPGPYQFSFAAPVPEPAVVGSMAVGLGMAGFMARRRRKAVKTA